MALETEMKARQLTPPPAQKTLCQKNEKGAKCGVQCDLKKGC